ncbi:MAG: diguanylate cyclase [Thermoanaerobaculia bacterium]
MTYELDRRSSPPDPAAQPLRLLVVEDDADYCSYIAALTRRLGFRVDTAVDGEAALERLGDAPYDLAIIDHELPRLKGIEAIERIRAAESTRSLYAVMLTACDDIETKVAALRAGFDDFLTKSSPEAELSAKLIAARRLVSRQRSMDVTIRDLYGLATRDDLTGVYNRRYFTSEAERLLSEGTPVNVVLLDLDGFKRVNDLYGHSAGDRVLRDVATALQSHTRPIDIVARLGGDEFVVAVPASDSEVLPAISERLTTAIEAMEWSGGGVFRVGASAGIASSRSLAEPTVQQLLAEADRDMYRNKERRNREVLKPAPDPPAEPGTPQLSPAV